VVSVDAIIDSECQNKKFMETVSTYNQSCFDACPNPT
jgi:hypothetical protein